MSEANENFLHIFLKGEIKTFQWNTIYSKYM